jgi:hypothetical protein
VLATIEHLRARAGAERWAAAAAAIRGGRDDGGLGNDLSSDIWWDAPTLRARERIDLTFELFEELPGYGVLMHVTGFYEDMAPEDRQHLWAHAARVLDTAGDPHADPLLYWLDMDVFGDGTDHERESWHALTGPDAGDGRMRRLLSVAQEVPFALKEPVYERFLPVRSWHGLIAASLRGSALERDGEAAVAGANDLIARLDLPHPHAGFRFRGRHR